MEYFIIFSILVVLLYIVYIWYKTQYSNYISDDVNVVLNDDDNKLLKHWYKMHIGDVVFTDTNELDVAANFLLIMYGIEVDTNLIVIGDFIDRKFYLEQTGQTLNTIYNDENIDCEGDIIYDIRSVLGLVGEIAIIHDQKLVMHMRRRTQSIDIGELDSIINSDICTGARDYLREVLKLRWDEIMKISPYTKHTTGSYLFLESGDKFHINEYPKDQMIDNIIGFFGTTNKGHIMTQNGRTNLLCSDYEFRALIDRWGKYNVSHGELSYI